MESPKTDFPTLSAVLPRVNCIIPMALWPFRTKGAYPNRSWQRFEADEGAAEGEERVVVIRASLIADGQLAILAEPGEGALNEPAMPAQLLTRLDPLAGD